MTDEELLDTDTGEITDPKLLLRKIGLYLDQHDGIESNIGVTHDYWVCINRYRLLTGPKE